MIICSSRDTSWAYSARLHPQVFNAKKPSTPTASVPAYYISRAVVMIFRVVALGPGVSRRNTSLILGKARTLLLFF